MTIDIKIDGKTMRVERGMSILEAAKSAEVHIPTLCYNERVSAYGSCRICTVEIEREGGRRRMVASCLYPVEEPISIFTDNEKVRNARRMLIELLLARCPDVKALQELAERYGLKKVRFSIKKENCILCGLCVRVCHELAGVGAIGFTWRGTGRKVGVPFEEERSDLCVACGACTYVCPTGAIQMEANTLKHLRQILSATERKCRYMRMGIVDYKVCPRNYECYHCEVDQAMEEMFGTHPVLARGRSLEKQPIKVDEFSIQPDLFYSAAHSWVKIIDGMAMVGMDDFARKILYPLDEIVTRKPNDEVRRGSAMCQVVCGRKKAEISSPVEGKILDINIDALENPRAISVLTGARGWIYTIQPTNMEKDTKELLTPSSAMKNMARDSERLHRRFSALGVTITDGGQISPALHERLSDAEWFSLVREFFSK